MQTGEAFRDGYVDVGGVAIHYVASTPDPTRGLPVLAVPGFGEAADEWEPFLARLAPRPAAAVSVRGRGRSDAPERGYRWEDHVDDVDAVVDAMGWDELAVVGFSRGSSYALGFALRHPRRVRALVIGDYEARHVGLGPSFVEASLKRRWNGRTMLERMPEHAIRGMQEESVEIPLWDRLGELTCPVLLIRPERRGILTDESVARWGAAVAALEVVTLAGTGHNMWTDDPEGFAALARDFVARVDPQP